jgi:hypothetical protein
VLIFVVALPWADDHAQSTYCSRMRSYKRSLKPYKITSERCPTATLKDDSGVIHQAGLSQLNGGPTHLAPGVARRNLGLNRVPMHDFTQPAPVYRPTTVAAPKPLNRDRGGRTGEPWACKYHALRNPDPSEEGRATIQQQRDIFRHHGGVEGRCRSVLALHPANNAAETDLKLTGQNRGSLPRSLWEDRRHLQVIG